MYLRTTGFFQSALSKWFLAELHPSIGIVSSYGLQGRKVAWDGLPYPTEFMPGREICRRTLLGGEYLLDVNVRAAARSSVPALSARWHTR